LLEAQRILLLLHREYPELRFFPKPSVDILMGAWANMGRRKISVAKFVDIMSRHDALVTLGWLTYSTLQGETASPDANG